MKSLSDSQLGLFGDRSEEPWSYSRLKTLRRCPLEYSVRWVNRQQLSFQPGYIDVQAGRLLHQILREYYRSEATSQPYRLLLEIYEKLAPTRDAWKEDLLGETRTLTALRLFADSKPARFRAVGLDVGCKAWIGGHLFTGQADLVYKTDEQPGVLGILEFKLNDVEVRSEDIGDRFLQCIIYYLGLPEQLQHSCEFANIYVLDSGEQLSTKIEPLMINSAIRIIEETLPLADGPDYPARLNPFCPSCGYQNLCPAYTKRHQK